MSRRVGVTTLMRAGHSHRHRPPVSAGAGSLEPPAPACSPCQPPAALLRHQRFPEADSMSEAQTPDAALLRLLATMARLRDPVAGCPWDQVQNFATIAPY